MNKRLIEEEVLFSLIEEQLNDGRKASFTVTGMSMWPFICHGRDSVIIDKSKEINLYDIILYKTLGGKYILHRVTDIHDDYITTTGDGNTFRDPVIHKQQVVAKVVSHTYKGKNVEESNKKYRILMRIWLMMYPIRSILLRLLKVVSKVKRMIHK